MCYWFWNALVLLVTVCLKCSAGQCWYYHVLSNQVLEMAFLAGKRLCSQQSPEENYYNGNKMTENVLF